MIVEQPLKLTDQTDRRVHPGDAALPADRMPPECRQICIGWWI
jgi:hypothetical protein